MFLCVICCLADETIFFKYYVTIITMLIFVYYEMEKLKRNKSIFIMQKFQLVSTQEYNIMDIIT